MKIAATEIKGSWTQGFVLDRHVESSEFLGYDSNGREQFDTKRTPLGEAVYRLKYSADGAQVSPIVSTAATFITEAWKARIDLVVPMPPSKKRSVQPVVLIAQALAKRLTIEAVEAVTKTKDTAEAKNAAVDQRSKMLEDAHKVDSSRVNGKNVLLVDDLIQSGATMNAVARALLKAGAARVFALALTRTKK